MRGRKGGPRRRGRGTSRGGRRSRGRRCGGCRCRSPPRRAPRRRTLGRGRASARAGRQGAPALPGVPGLPRGRARHGVGSSHGRAEPGGVDGRRAEGRTDEGADDRPLVGVERRDEAVGVVDHRRLRRRRPGRRARTRCDRRRRPSDARMPSAIARARARSASVMTSRVRSSAKNGATSRDEDRRAVLLHARRDAVPLGTLDGVRPGTDLHPFGEPREGPGEHRGRGGQHERRGRRQERRDGDRHLVREHRLRRRPRSRRSRRPGRARRSSGRSTDGTARP